MIPREKNHDCIIIRGDSSDGTLIINCSSPPKFDEQVILNTHVKLRNDVFKSTNKPRLIGNPLATEVPPPKIKKTLYIEILELFSEIQDKNYSILGEK